MSNPKFEFELMVESYLKSVNDETNISELEIRFGTKSINRDNYQNITKSITKIDFDNVIKQLYNSGFKCDNTEGQYLLRVTPEIHEQKSSKVRLEIVGIDLIQSYCESGEDLQELMEVGRNS